MREKDATKAQSRARSASLATAAKRLSHKLRAVAQVRLEVARQKGGEVPVRAVRLELVSVFDCVCACAREKGGSGRGACEQKNSRRATQAARWARRHSSYDHSAPSSSAGLSRGLEVEEVGRGRVCQRRPSVVPSSSPSSPPRLSLSAPLNNNAHLYSSRHT